MAAIDKEAGDPFLRTMRCVVDAGGDEDDKEIGVAAAGDEVLGAVQHPVAAVAPRRGAHAAHIRSGVRFGHGQRVHLLAANGRRQIAFHLIALAGHQDVLRAAEEMCQRHRAAAELALEKRKLKIVETAATDRFRKIRGIEPHFHDLVLDGVAHLQRHMAELLDLVLERIDFRFDETPDRRDDHFLFFGQSELHGYPLCKSAADGTPRAIRARQVGVCGCQRRQLRRHLVGRQAR